MEKNDLVIMMMIMTHQSNLIFRPSFSLIIKFQFFPDFFFHGSIVTTGSLYTLYAKNILEGACVNHRNFKRVEYTLQRSCVHQDLA